MQTQGAVFARWGVVQGAPNFEAWVRATEVEVFSSELRSSASELENSASEMDFSASEMGAAVSEVAEAARLKQFPTRARYQGGCFFRCQKCFAKRCSGAGNGRTNAWRHNEQS